MKLSELSTATGVAPATIKYYLREGLLPPGARVSATRADYATSHVERLRLVRALAEGAGMAIDGVRRVVGALDNPPQTRHELLGIAQEAIDGPVPDVEVSEETLALADGLGWRGCSPERLAHLQAALDHAARAGITPGAGQLRAYAAAMSAVATTDLDGFADDPARLEPAGAVHYAAVGTVVTDLVLVALRRLAQEHESQRRYAAETGAARSAPGESGDDVDLDEDAGQL